MGTRILIDCHVFDQSFEGIRTFLTGLINELILHEDISLILVAHDINYLEQEFGSHLNVKYEKLKTKNKYKRLCIEIPRLIKKTSATHALFNYTVPLVRIKGCKYLTVLHDVLFLDFPEYFPSRYRVIHKALFKYSIRLSDKILTVSEYSRNRINHHFGLKIESKHVIPNAVENDILFSKKISGEVIFDKFKVKDFILFVSRVETRKNHELVLNWYLEKKIYEKDIQLIFVGRQVSNIEQTRKIFAEATIISKGMFRHISQVDKDDLYHFYNAAKIAVYPSLCEGFGIPPLESALLRTPTICSNRTAMKDFSFFGDFHIDPILTDFTKNIEDFLFNSDGLDANKFLNISEEIKYIYSWKKSAQRLKEMLD